MNDKLIEVKELLLNKVFYYSDSGNPDQRKTFFCKDIEVKNHRFVVDCEVRKFVFLMDEIDRFIKSIQFENLVAKVNDVKSISSSLSTVNQNVTNISDALFEMFNKVATKTASKEDLDNAKLMIGLSNQLIGIEKIKLGYYNLQKK